jgi:hypothetical protein
LRFYLPLPRCDHLLRCGRYNQSYSLASPLDQQAYQFPRDLPENVAAGDYYDEREL